MAKKQLSFAEKAMKGKSKEESDLLHNARVISMFKSPKGTWKFNDRVTVVTTQNQKEIMG